jgi:Tol biopolymer transport system component
MKLKSTWIAIVLMTATACTALALQNSAQYEVLFEKARFLMETKGDLDGAIEIFDEILNKYPNERDYAAKSLYFTGICYEKLGKQQAQQARAAFQRIVSDYPEQLEEVKLAREQLAALSKASYETTGKPSFRQIRVPSALPFGAQLSPDGTLLAYAQYEKGLWLLPIQGNVSPDVAGVPKKLPVSLLEDVGIDRDGLAWSADGKWIAFNDFNLKREKGPWSSGIYVVSSKGGIPRKVSVYPERGEKSYDWRLGLSPDGKQLAFTSQENGKYHLETIPVHGGQIKQLTEYGSTEPAYSPDGRLIAYVSKSMDTTLGETKRFEHSPGGVWVVPSDGGTPVLVADVKSQANYPIWSPDGRMIAFRADEAIWVVPVSTDGKPTAEPTKFDPPLPFSSVLAGWTNDDKIGLVLSRPGYSAIYTVPASGGQASQVTPPNVWSNPKWSPDGERIFFNNTDGHISSVPAEGGKIMDVPMSSNAKILEPGVGGENAIAPDGRTIVFAGVKDGLPGIQLWTIPVAGGEPTQLTSDLSEAIENRFPCWSSDGKWIAFVRGERLKDDMQYYSNVNIYKMPAEGGEPTPLTTALDKVGFRDIALSPNGNSVAYFSGEDNMTIKVKSLETGESRIAGKAERHGWNSLSWSPDGKKIAFTPASNVQGPFSRIRIISLNDGTTTPLETGLPESDYWHVSWSPDGTKLAFGAIQNGETEFWFMEDFLPLVKR